MNPVPSLVHLPLNFLLHIPRPPNTKIPDRGHACDATRHRKRNKGLTPLLPHQHIVRPSSARCRVLSDVSCQEGRGRGGGEERKREEDVNLFFPGRSGGTRVR